MTPGCRHLLELCGFPVLLTEAMPRDRVAVVDMAELFDGLSPDTPLPPGWRWMRMGVEVKPPGEVTMDHKAIFRHAVKDARTVGDAAPADGELRRGWMQCLDYLERQYHDLETSPESPYVRTVLPSESDRDAGELDVANLRTQLDIARAAHGHKVPGIKGAAGAILDCDECIGVAVKAVRRAHRVEAALTARHLVTSHVQGLVSGAANGIRGPLDATEVSHLEGIVLAAIKADRLAR